MCKSCSDQAKSTLNPGANTSLQPPASTQGLHLTALQALLNFNMVPMAPVLQLPQIQLCSLKWIIFFQLLYYLHKQASFSWTSRQRFDDWAHNDYSMLSPLGEHLYSEVENSKGMGHWGGGAGWAVFSLSLLLSSAMEAKSQTKTMSSRPSHKWTIHLISLPFEVSIMITRLLMWNK